VARQSLVKNERYEMFQAKLLTLCLRRAGTWAALAREFPMSESHLYLLRAGKSKPGPEILCRMMEYGGIFDHFTKHLEKVLNGTDRRTGSDA
jgi:hypothetical protein